MSVTEAADVAWDLDHLIGDDDVDGLLKEAGERATAFQAQAAGKVADLDGPGLSAAMAELAAINDIVGRAANYASLRFSVDTADPAIGALLAKVQERGTEIGTKLIFFELEWAQVPDATADELLKADGLELVQHELRSVRRYRDHLLSEPEEKILTEKDQSGSSAWSRLFSEHTSAIEVEEPDGGTVALDVALSRLSSPDRALRAATQEAVTKALEPGLRTRAFIFNTLLLDKSVDDRLRKYPSWLSSRNLSNEATDESVQALVEAVKDAYEIPQRWYRLKARYLGIDRLADYDRAASVAEVDEEFAWEDARDIVLESFDAFSPVLGSTAKRFFDEQWIDAPVRPGKRGGAFCAYTVPSVHPYVLLNWTAKRRDVLTLAHELGHGMHAALAQPRGIFEQGTPLTLAETASVFGETLVFDKLLKAAPDAKSRLSLLAENIEGSIATVFRQTAMNQFEQAVHTARREQGELSVETFGELWAATQEDLLGDAVEVTQNYRSWWSYIPHFIGTPGYVYAYAYGQLLALSVYGEYLKRGEEFVPSYVELLSAGGSKSPEGLAEIAGLDLADPGFWRSGLDLVRGQLEEAEKAAEEVMAAR